MIDLYERQAQIERDMVQRGIDKYETMRRKAEEDGETAAVTAYNIVTNAALGPLTDAIVAYMDESAKSRVGAVRTAYAKLKHVDPVKLAYVVLFSSLDEVIVDRKPFATFATKLGSFLEVEAYFTAEQEADPDRAAARIHDIDKRSDTTRHRRTIARHAMGESIRAGEIEGWTAAEKLHVGTKMIELLVESTGLMEVYTVREGRRLVTSVRPSERLRSWLVDLHMAAALMQPHYLPTVVPPRDWTSVTEGGYLTDALVRPPKLVKTSSKQHPKLLQGADLSVVMAGVNSIQRTPWKVNSRVLKVAEELVLTGATVAGLPPMEDEPVPAAPEDFDADPEVTREWKAAASAVHRKNRKLLSKRVQALQAIATAKDYEEYDAFYFPHQCDFRGRVYPIPSGLSPQGMDLQKGLLMFSEGKPLGSDEGVQWFSIHGANTFGVDKVSFEERLQWVMAHQALILACALSPLDETWWQEADSPFCFLAWCFEYADAIYYNEAGESPHDFVSHIPVAVDGSCNGLQHYSAMLRDPRGAAATNLIPADKPQDIYGEVAKAVISSLQGIIANPEATAEDRFWAQVWLDYGVDRTLCKRPVMVLPYGGTLNATQRYVAEVAADSPPGRFKADPAQFREGCNWMAKQVWNAMTEVVVGAVSAMGWLRGLSRAVSDDKRAIEWTTPTGFKVRQDYYPSKLVRVETVLFGKRFQPALRETVDDGSVDRMRQANGLPPNFVHSLDASALILTVNASVGQGITSFAMIHDSYGTHAADMPTLSRVLREEFVAMYRQDILTQLRDEVLPGGTPERSFEPPHIGGFDLEEVLGSLYFFA